MDDGDEERKLERNGEEAEHEKGDQYADHDLEDGSKGKLGHRFVPGQRKPKGLRLC